MRPVSIPTVYDASDGTSAELLKKLNRRKQMADVNVLEGGCLSPSSSRKPGVSADFTHDTTPEKDEVEHGSLRASPSSGDSPCTGGSTVEDIMTYKN